MIRARGQKRIKKHRRLQRCVLLYTSRPTKKQLFFLTTKKISSLFLQKNLKNNSNPKISIDFPPCFWPQWDKYYQFSHLFLYRRMKFRLKFNFFNIFSFCDVFFAKKNMNFGGNDLWQKPLKKGKRNETKNWWLYSTVPHTDTLSFSATLIYICPIIIVVSNLCLNY